MAHVKVAGAWAHLFMSVVAGVYATVFVATSTYEKILMGISWYAVFITAVDVLLSAQVQRNQEEKKE